MILQQNPHVCNEGYEGTNQRAAAETAATPR